MREITTTLTKKGQVTVPVEIRNFFGLKTNDKITFKISDGIVQISPAKYSIEDVYGIVKPINKPENFKKIREDAVKEYVQKVYKEMNE
jgi:antitoxin PrlF